MQTRLIASMLAFCLMSAAVAADVRHPGLARFYALMEKQYGKAGRERIEGWFDLMTQATQRPAMPYRSRLEQANNYFNQVPWVSDEQHWQQRDYWATPVEMLGTHGGDCEDFAVGKYFTLSETDFDTEKLRITYVKSLTYQQAHMVLAYYPTPTAEPLILDNINKTIQPASARRDLVPVYSFNGDSIWLAKNREKKLAGGVDRNLPKWRDLNNRMKPLRSQIKRVKP